MPIQPWDIRDPVTREFPESIPGADQLNAAQSAFCPAYNLLEDWQQSLYGSLFDPTGGLASLVFGRNVFNVVCDPSQSPPQSPVVPGMPLGQENCPTSGVLRFMSSSQPLTPVFPGNIGEFFWDCSDDIGYPIEQFEWGLLPPSSFYGWQARFRRPGAGGTVRLSMGEANVDNPNLVRILTVQVNPCPSCTQPPPPPPLPGSRPQIVIPPGEPPQITIPISIPQGVGVPSIEFPVTFSPQVNLDIDASLRPAITLAPRVDLNPDFSFAPTFEFSTGGLSIGGGGYPEPRESVQDLADCDCPDPCPPPADMVDYSKVQSAVANVISQRWRLPGFDRDPFLGSATAFGEAVLLDLDPDCIAVRIQVDTTNYFGGGTPTVNGIQGAGYYGWYTIQSGSSVAAGSERVFISSVGGFVAVPPFAYRMTATAQNGALIRLTQVRIGDIPEPPE